LGLDKGFFKEQGLDLKLQSLRGGEATVPAVVSGSVQFGFSNLTSLLIARDKGLPLTVVAPGNASTGVQGKDFGGIIVGKNSSVQSVKDLEGKTVSVNSVNNIADSTLGASMRKAGGDPSKIKYIEVAFADVPAAIEKGQVDAAWVVEPFLTIAKNQGARVLTSNLVDTAPNLTMSAYFTSESQAQSDPQLLEKFKAAMKKSLEYADTHADEARQAVLGYTSIQPEIAQQMTLPRWPSDVDRSSVQVLADLALKGGLISKEANLDGMLPR
jgi:NitT/TauT family transport system substrate-binding protein